MIAKCKSLLSVSARVYLWFDQDSSVIGMRLAVHVLCGLRSVSASIGQLRCPLLCWCHICNRSVHMSRESTYSHTQCIAALVLVLLEL